MSVEEDNLRRLMEGARGQMQSSYREFQRRLEEGASAPPAPAPRFQWGRITMAATLLVCLTVLATIVVPRQDGTAPVRPQDADPQIEALVKQLSDDRPEVREEATRKLVALGEPAAARLKSHLDDKDPEVVARARRIIDEVYRAILDLPEAARTKLARVEAEVKRLREAKQGAEADALDARLRAVRREVIAGSWRAGDKPEVHVVGLYEPKRDDDQTVVVRVTCTDGPVILILCAYEQVFWKVEVGKETSLRKVIVGGYHHQDVQGVPKGVTVDKHVYEDNGGDYFSAYKRDDDGWRTLVARVRTLTGADLSSFQGSYSYSGEPFVLGPTNAEWLAQRRAAHVERFCAEALRGARERQVADLERFRFWAVAAGDGMRGGTSIGEFTVRGPVAKTLIDTKTALVQAVADDKGRVWGATSSGIVSIDPKTGACTELAQEKRADLPRVSGVSGLAYDSKRGRLLLTAAGILYAVDPEKNAWTVVGRFGRLERVSALAYAADEDVTYACVAAVQDLHSLRTIARLDADGGVIDQITLSEPVPVNIFGGLQLACVGRRLVLLVPPGRDENGGLAGGSRTVVVDRATGEVELTK